MPSPDLSLPLGHLFTRTIDSRAVDFIRPSDTDRSSSSSTIEGGSDPSGRGPGLSAAARSAVGDASVALGRPRGRSIALVARYPVGSLRSNFCVRSVRSVR